MKEGRSVLLVESYDFGRIKVGGRKYDVDLIFYSTGEVYPGWWRREGHAICLEDLEEVLKDPPEVLVVGTGYHGLVKVLDEVREKLRVMGVELIEAPTAEACEKYNELCKSGRRVAAALHLTC